MPAPLPQETQERFVHMFVEDGMSMQKIAEATGHCVDSVRQALLRHRHRLWCEAGCPGYFDNFRTDLRPYRRGGIPLRANSRLPHGVYEEAVRLYVYEYRSLKQVASALSISETTVKRAVLMAGYRLRPRVWGNRNRHLPQQEVEAAVAAVQEHGSVSKAAEASGMKPSEIWTRLKIAGVDPPQRVPIRREHILEARKLKRQGLTREQIAERMGMSYHRVRRLLARR